jgi:hypothetical protein
MAESAYDPSDDLMSERCRLAHELGAISARLVKDNQDYHDCIEGIMASNQQLRERGIDTVALGISIAQQARAAQHNLRIVQ